MQIYTRCLFLLRFYVVNVLKKFISTFLHQKVKGHSDHLSVANVDCVKG